MADYLLIESRDPFETKAVSDDFALAGDLAAEGNKVTLFLVQNGVLPARESSATDLCQRASERGVQVLADEFSLRERGIGKDGLAPGVDAAPLEIVVDQLAEGRKTLWF